MITPREIAIEYIEHAIRFGFTANQVLHSWTSSCTPDRGEGSVYMNIAGGAIFPDRDSAEKIKIKPYQMGIVIYRKNAPSDYEVFDLRKLWSEHVNPKQLSLWESDGDRTTVETVQQKELAHG